MLNFKLFVNSLFSITVFSNKLSNFQDIFLNLRIELFLKHSKNIFWAYKAVSIAIVQEKSYNMRLSSFHKFEPFTYLLKLFKSNVSPELIKICVIKYVLKNQEAKLSPNLEAT